MSTQDTADMERPPPKRPGSPSASCPQNQPAKRPCLDQDAAEPASTSVPPSASQTRCLHCGADGHDFSECITWCKDCQVGLPGFLCPHSRGVQASLPAASVIANADATATTDAIATPAATIDAATDTARKTNAIATTGATAEGGLKNSAAYRAVALFPRDSGALPEHNVNSQTVIRSDDGRKPEEPFLRCLKCGGTGHLPTHCNVRILNPPQAPAELKGGSQAPITSSDSREPEMPWVAARLPSAGLPALDGVSSERLAMIAAPPTVEEEVEEEAGFDERLGPLQSGTNTMPLGRPRRNLSGSVVQSSGQSDLADLRAKVEATRGVPPRGPASAFRHAPVPAHYPAPAPALHPADRMMGYGSAASLGAPPGLEGGFSIYGASKNTSRFNDTYPPTYQRPGRAPSNQSRSSTTRPSPADAAPSMNGPPRGPNQRPSRPPTNNHVFNMTSNAIDQANKFRGTTNKSNKKNVERYSAHHMGIWADLNQHIADVVHGARDPSRDKNNGDDHNAVRKALNAASNMLRPFVLRDQRRNQRNPDLSQRAGFTQVRVGNDGFPIQQDDEVHVKSEH
ncbi:hypothetical protein CB0940_09255 [Cercospora beticola]|uniref:CCHC-type domain-containing protein n=1 Tax=Cercospora beticola TaxID=122368 RepID=A0A2G5HGQ4_CERBT|nr:hypothetical protein CB0940_09255 [Cercospora beticola]PIA91720.1 hypothetical protein CB0940_09255 [Cercospora beticola]WPB06440.1 hypothetical protein RHO25_011097 [Cercospora beticola]